MAHDTTSQSLLSMEEFFAMEESATRRHEFLGGVPFAVRGTNVRHNLLVGNIASATRPVARERGCSVLTETIKLRIENDIVYYPDIMVVCDPTDNDPMHVVNPCLIVEVLSPTTASFDRREKAMAYRRVPELKTYLIVYQDERHIERFWLNDRGGWEHAELHRTGFVPLPCPGIELTLDDLYLGIDV